MTFLEESFVTLVLLLTAGVVIVFIIDLATRLPILPRSSSIAKDWIATLKEEDGDV